jgi:hypothetical protein
LEDVVEVFRHLISPFVLYVSKYSKELYKEHKEEFIWAGIAKKIRPKFIFSDELIPFTIHNDDHGSIEAHLYRADVIFNQGELMCTSYGSNKRQAERNASILGLSWLETNFKNGFT